MTAGHEEEITGFCGTLFAVRKSAAAFEITIASCAISVVNVNFNFLSANRISGTV